MTPEIRAFEYALGLAAVLIGLSVADIAISFHKLIRHRSEVVWDPLALFAALYALCMAIGMWFDLWAVREVAEARSFLFFLSVIADLFVLFLTAAASLPDEAADRDLRQYYDGNRRYFWMLVAIYWMGYLLHGLYFAVGAVQRSPISANGSLIIQMTAPLLLAVVLFIVKSRLVHYLGLALLFAWMLYYYGHASIN